MSFMPFVDNASPEELRKRWLNRYLAVQAKHDTRMRTVLIEAAEQAFSQIIDLDKSTTFSNGVRTAQLKLVLQQVRSVLNDIFGQTLKLIPEGQRNAASAAALAFNETDRRYLQAAFSETGSVSQFIESQRQQAMLGVTHAISRVYKSNQPLSARVYRTRSLANNWVSRQVNSGLVRGASAKELAMSVRTSIRPNVSGGVSYAAMRLGRTELNNAFHATSISLSQDRPWVEGMAWHLSKVHEHIPSGVPEICEVYAGQTFHADHVPAKPHPQCRCFVTPQVEPFESFLTHLTAGTYRSWIQDAA